jgi:hypothetical protein
MDLMNNGTKECRAHWEGELGMFHPEDLELIPEHIRIRLTPTELESFQTFVPYWWYNGD